MFKNRLIIKNLVIRNLKEEFKSYKWIFFIGLFVLLKMEGLKLNKKNIYLMYLIIFLQSLVFYGSIATLYRQKRGLSMTEIFIIESAYFIIVIILEVPWGKLADKIGYKKIVVIANFIYFLSKIVFYNSGSFLGFHCS